MFRSLLEAGMVCALIGCPFAAGAAGPPARPKLSLRGEIGATYLYLDGGSGVVQSDEAGDFWLLGGGAALDAAWDKWHIQADFGGEGNINERSANDTYLDSYGGGLHFNLRDPERGSVGIFSGLGTVETNDLNAPDPETLSWIVGGEGQIYFEPVTLYLQAGYADRQSIRSGGDVDVLKNAGFGRAVARYFPCDQVELSAETSYTQGRMDPDEDLVWILGWGAGAEWRPRGWPVSGFVDYLGAHYDQKDDNDQLDEHRIMFGLRFYFGQETLKANDRHGASLDLPRWLQLSGQTGGVLE